MLFVTKWELYILGVHLVRSTVSKFLGSFSPQALILFHRRLTCVCFSLIFLG